MINNGLFKNIEDLVGTLEQYDADTLKNLCAFLISEYVMKNGVSYDGEVDERPAAVNAASVTANIATFSDLIKDMQRRYNFTELQKFSVDGSKVFLDLDGRKIALNGNNTERNSPPASYRPTTAPTVNKIPTPAAPSSDGDSQSRFRSLEIDE